MMKWMMVWMLLCSVGMMFGQSPDLTLYFESGDANPGAEARHRVEVAWGKADPADIVTVKIVGYCDSIGSMNSNMELSIRRATSISQVLKDLGVTVPIMTDGKGELMPVADNGTDQGKAQNRRAEVIFIRRPPVVVTTPPDTVKEVLEEVPEPETTGPLVFSEDAEVKAGQRLKLKNVNFVGGQAIPLPESEPTLKELVRFMKKHPTVKILIEGHVCCANDYNLSVARAKMVFKYLSKHGINEDRMYCKGYGNTRPLVRGFTEAANIMNRRVEVVVMEE
ncbi:MAG: OmpA family protein [Flavobacteriales bacterium]|nr:OmpA family protein [Flavobacteriales bacterium]